MNILVAYDGSDVAKTELTVACRHAKAFGGKIHLAACLTKRADQQLQQIERMQKELAESKAVLAADGISCDTHILIRGLTAGEELVQFAREKAIDMIVIGVRRRSRVGKLVFGSTAQYVILQADCLVLCVK